MKKSKKNWVIVAFRIKSVLKTLSIVVGALAFMAIIGTLEHENTLSVTLIQTILILIGIIVGSRVVYILCDNYTRIKYAIVTPLAIATLYCLSVIACSRIIKTERLNRIYAKRLRFETFKLYFRNEKNALLNRIDKAYTKEFKQVEHQNITIQSLIDNNKR